MFCIEPTAIVRHCIAILFLLATSVDLRLFPSSFFF